MSLTLFYVFAAIAVIGALGMLFNVRNTVAAAMSLVGTMVSLGAIYVLLDAYLIGVLQILVYAGAIVVLFLFVVMLLNLRHDTLAPTRRPFAKWLGAILGIAVAVALLSFVPGSFAAPAEIAEGFGGYREVGLELFHEYALAFELTSLLLLAAMVGAVVLAKRKVD